MKQIHKFLALSLVVIALSACGTAPQDAPIVPQDNQGMSPATTSTVEDMLRYQESEAAKQKLADGDLYIKAQLDQNPSLCSDIKDADLKKMCVSEVKKK